MDHTNHQALIARITNEDNKEYTISELLDELLKDDSWEADFGKRMQVVMVLKIKFDNA